MNKDLLFHLNPYINIKECTYETGDWVTKISNFSPLNYCTTKNSDWFILGSLVSYIGKQKWGMKEGDRKKEDEIHGMY